MALYLQFACLSCSDREEVKMDLFNVRAIEITKLAMDGLSQRQTAIASNTANSMTPDYQRKQVAFEDQLREIIERDNIRRDLRMENSLAYQKNIYKPGAAPSKVHSPPSHIPTTKLVTPFTPVTNASLAILFPLIAEKFQSLSIV